MEMWVCNWHPNSGDILPREVIREEEATDAAAEFSGPVVVMHMRGTPRDMQRNPSYRDVVGEIKEFFRRRLRELSAKGIRGEIAFGGGG